MQRKPGNGGIRTELTRSLPSVTRLAGLALALALLITIVGCSGSSNAPTSGADSGDGDSSRGTDDENADGGKDADSDKGSGSAAGGATGGGYAADLGFRPEANGFSFENYGGQGETNLTPADLRRMFGDVACATIQSGRCILTPPAQQWLKQINQAMGDGHCEGMAVLSNLFYTGEVDVSGFGASSVPALVLAGNEPLQREIAYWWATQATEPARTGIVQQTPSGVLNTLLISLAAGPSGGDQFALGIYKRDFTGGHAITPYAVEDRGGGLYRIMVYDNNYPGQARAVEVDTNSDTWRYSGSTNPAEAEDEYEGDANTLTLELAPIAPRLSQQVCPFCAGRSTSGTAGRAIRGAQQTFNQVWLDGDADLLITDAAGRSVGFRNGVFVNEIPGSITNANKFGVNVWDVRAEPVYYIPSDIDFTVVIDGSRLTGPSNSSVTMIGPGYALEVSDIILEPGQVDTLDVAPDGSLISYRTFSRETPFLLVAVETDAADYLFGVYGEELAPGEALNLSLDTEQGWLSIDAIDNTASGSYGLVVARYDENGEQVFGAEGIVLEPDDVLYVDYLLWPGNGEPMSLDLDYFGDGTVDETIQVDDVTDEIAS